MTLTSDKFCLKWNDFQQNIITSYQDLRNESEFSDVTLVSEDNLQVKAHRIIITGCSPIFRTMLKKYKHSNSMIYMRGVKAKELEAIVDFIYYGEANIYQGDLDGFLALAEELQLKGLVGSQNKTYEEEFTKKNAAQSKPKPKPVGQPMTTLPEYETKTEGSWPVESNRVSDSDQSDLMKYNESHSILQSEESSYELVPAYAGKVVVNANMENIKGQINSMMEKGSNGEYKCIVCEKSLRNRQDMSRHIETHIEGITYPCNQCGTLKRSSVALKIHRSRFHK